MKRSLIDWRSFEDHSALAGVRRHLRNHIAEPMSLSRAASIAGLDRTHFPRFFRDRVGIAFSDWVSLERVLAAKKWLRTGDSPVTEVCRRVGFNSLRTFERAFKMWTGRSPAEYKHSVEPHSPWPW